MLPFSGLLNILTVLALMLSLAQTMGNTEAGSPEGWLPATTSKVYLPMVISNYMPLVLSQSNRIASGYDHTCVVTTTGGVKCWGLNGDGQLGDDTRVSHSTPQDVQDLLNSGVSAVVAGTYFTCALMPSGGVNCWGKNDSGQLGDGTKITQTIPVAVKGLTYPVTAMAAGWYHTCVLTKLGGVMCWGNNNDGQLGDGTYTSHSGPTAVSGLTSKIVAITAGWNHTCALTAEGAVECWGWNSFGQLGNGTTNNSPTPVVVQNLASGVIGIAAGSEHTCALTATGGVKCWGWNMVGQLGDGTTASHSSPVDVQGLASGVSAISGGNVQTCALTTAGGVKCWGDNFYGEVGDGSTANRYTPVDVQGLTSGMSVIAAGDQHTCALTKAGGAKCWGDNHYGQLGNGTTSDRYTPDDVQGLANGMSAIAAGAYHTCALTAAGGVKCWGYNNYGSLGDGTTTSHSTPVDVPALPSGVNSIVAGWYHTCALTTLLSGGQAAGGVKCWGRNDYGQIGDSTNTDRSIPTDVPGLTSGVTALAAGVSFTCALKTGVGVECWGWNSDGQLGDGTTNNSSTPVLVQGLGSNEVRAIAAGSLHACVLTTAGGVKCWGYNGDGELGNNTTNNSFVPVDVKDLTSGVSAISIGTYHTCALTTTGGIKCWGWNLFGQLGNATYSTSTIPVDVKNLTSGVSAIAAGSDHTCAVTALLSGGQAGGAVKCWGSNDYGEVGNGTTTRQSTPQDVQGLASGMSIIAAGEDHTCALTTAGGVKCWGSGGEGQLGYAATLWVPVSVIGWP